MSPLCLLCADSCTKHHQAAGSIPTEHHGACDKEMGHGAGEVMGDEGWETFAVTSLSTQE